MNRYLFLLAWFDGSDSACGEHTKVHSQEDLLPQFRKGNGHVFAVEVHADDENTAAAYGYKEAFFNGFTAYDSTSLVHDLRPKAKLKEPIKVIVVEP